jgi:protein-L-isoaspartate(D-aspartate) O-methyltransferase
MVIPVFAVIIMRHPRVQDDFGEQRCAMVAQIAARGVRSRKVLAAMAAVPREEFVPDHLRKVAYDDSPLPIAAGQTISQPHVVAFMVEALDLQGGERVLEVGAGSGYAAAVLAQIAGRVYTIERIEELAQGASKVLDRLGYANVEVRLSDGTLGWPEEAPFDAITVAAGTREIPHALKDQLETGGRLVIPVGRNQNYQQLVRITRVATDEFAQEDLVAVRFVPLIGGDPPRPGAS